MAVELTVMLRTRRGFAAWSSTRRRRSGQGTQSGGGKAGQVEPTHVTRLRSCDVAGWQAVPCFSRSCVDTSWPFDLTLYIIYARPMPVGYDHDLRREQRGLPLLSPVGSLYRKTFTSVEDDCFGAPIAFRSPCPCLLFRPSTLPFGHLGSQACHFGLRASALASSD